MVISINQHLSNIEAQFMKKLSNTEDELKKVCYELKNRVTPYPNLKFLG